MKLVGLLMVLVVADSFANPLGGVVRGMARTERVVANSVAHGVAAETRVQTRAMFEQMVSKAETNRQYLRMQENIQRNVTQAARATKAAPTFTKGFNAQANPGVVYERIGSGRYIGQSKSLPRFGFRQMEHNAAFKRKDLPKPEYRIVGGAPGGDRTLLRVAEETAIRTRRLEQKVALTNSIPAMNDRKFTDALKGKRGQ